MKTRYENDLGTRKKRWSQPCKDSFYSISLRQDNLEGVEGIKKEIMRAKPIIQYDLSGNMISEFPSTYHAEAATGIDRTHILKVLKCRGGRKRTGEFTWKYGEETARNEKNN